MTRGMLLNKHQNIYRYFEIKTIARNTMYLPVQAQNEGFQIDMLRMEKNRCDADTETFMRGIFYI